jgi:hypothetical protein
VLDHHLYGALLLIFKDLELGDATSLSSLCERTFGFRNAEGTGGLWNGGPNIATGDNHSTHSWNEGSWLRGVWDNRN